MTPDGFPTDALTVKEIVDEVIRGDTMLLPVSQLAQFLYECDLEGARSLLEGPRFEFCIDIKIQGNAAILTRWNLEKTNSKEENNSRKH